MAAFQIEWKRSAAKDLQALSASTISRIMEAVAALAEHPRPYGAIKLAGSDQTYRLRLGDYRIVYTIHQAVLVIEIVRVAHRRDVYR